MNQAAALSAADFQALAGLLVLGGGVLAVMLTISFRRHHAVTAMLTLVTLAAALVGVVVAGAAAPRAVTPLLLVDGMALYFSTLFLIAAVVTTGLSHRYLQGGRDDPEEYYLLLLAATLGAVTLAGASHFASLLLGLEILSISLYALIAYPQAGHKPLEAALKYLILSGAASTTMLFGMALIFAATGSLTFAAVATLAQPAAEPYLLLGTVMLIAGMAFKLSLVPFHMWTPDVYQGAPAPVAGFLAAVSKGAVAAVALRFLIDGGLLGQAWVQGMLGLLAVASMFVGNLLALQQRSLKRLLAYSAIAHIGYLLVPLVAIGGSDPWLATEAVLLYVAAYVVMTLTAFGIVTVLSGRQVDGDADDLSAYQGLFWRRPALATVLTVVLLSLAGIPLTVGFIAKFYLFAAGVTAGAWLLLAALVVGSGIGLYYYLRIVFAMTEQTAQRDDPAALPGQWTIGILGVMLVAFGVYPAPFIDAVRQALGGLAG